MQLRLKPRKTETSLMAKVFIIKTILFCFYFSLLAIFLLDKIDFPSTNKTYSSKKLAMISLSQLNKLIFTIFLNIILFLIQQHSDEAVDIWKKKKIKKKKTIKLIMKKNKL